MLSKMYKAVFGGLAAMVSTLLANPANSGALHTLEHAVVAYLIGHVVVYLAPANKS